MNINLLDENQLQLVCHSVKYYYIAIIHIYYYIWINIFRKLFTK